MRGRAARFSCLVCCVVLVVSFGAARVARAEGEPGAAGDVGDAGSVRADGVELGSLARLAELERLRGNGGAEEERSAVLAGYDKKDGFFVKDASSDNLLKIKAQLQIRYTYKGRDQRGSTVDAGEIGGEDDSFFELERARLVFEGNVLSQNLTYKAQIDGDSDGSNAVKTLDVYVEYWAGDALGADTPDILGIGAGQFKPYFMRQEPTSSASLQMVDRSLTTEFFNIDRNVGAWIRGDIGPVFYAFAVTNGFDSVGVAPAAIDQVPAFVGKLDFQLWGDDVKRGKYEEGNTGRKDLGVIGISGATDRNNNSSGVGGPKHQVYQFGIDTAIKADRFSLQAEYVGRWIDYEVGNASIPGGDGSSQYAHGFYVQGGFLVADNWEVVGLGSFVWCDGKQNGNAVQVGPGLNWYISGNHKIKLQTDVTYFDISPNLQDSTEDLDGSAGSTTSSTASSFSSTAAQLAAGEQGVMWRTQLQLSF